MPLVKNDVLKQLIECARKGDKEAFCKLYDMYHNAINGYIRGRVLRDTDVDDISQKTWTDVWESLADYNCCKGSFYAWVRSIAQRKIWEYNKSKRKECIEAKDIEAIQDSTVIEESEVTIADIIKDLKSGQYTGRAFPPAIYEYLLRNTFKKGGYPWQILAFGFSKLLSGWPPRRIVGELSCLKLKELVEELEQGYIAESMLSKTQICGAFRILHKRMNCQVGEILSPHDSVSQERLKCILGDLVGDTKLCNYYGQDAEASIADWSYKVKKRKFRELLQDC